MEIIGTQMQKTNSMIMDKIQKNAELSISASKET